MGQALLASRSGTLAADALWMAETVMRYSPATDAEALKLLRASFPDCPLSLRVAALNLLMRNSRRPAGLPR